MSDNIKNGFKRCGLYPFDPNSPDYTKCVRNIENLKSTDANKDFSRSDIEITKKVLNT